MEGRNGRESVPTVSLSQADSLGACGLLQVWHWEGCPNSSDGLCSMDGKTGASVAHLPADCSSAQVG